MADLGRAIVGVLTTAIFLLIERHTRSPMLPLELFASTTFSAANVVGLLPNFGFYGQFLLINLFFQQAGIPGGLVCPLDSRETV